MKHIITAIAFLLLTAMSCKKNNKGSQTGAKTFGCLVNSLRNDSITIKSYSAYRLQNLNKAYVTTNILYGRMSSVSITNSKTNRL